MPEARFSSIFAPELYGRLRWFSNLRWMAVGGLVLGAIVGPFVGFAGAWPSLLYVGLLVAVYNLLFVWRLSRYDSTFYGELHECAIRQMVADLAALAVTIHYTGGMESPALIFFAFHMAIGTIMVATRLMYLLAAGASAVLTAIYFAEHSHWLVSYAQYHHEMGAEPASRLVLLMVAMFGMVYLTDSVTSRFKVHAIELHRTGEDLLRKTEQLEALVRQKEELEQRKSHYMRISAHQLRSPLGTVKTSLEVLTGGYVDPASERGKKLLAGAIERVDGLLEIVNDLLELAKVREGRDKAPWKSGINLTQLVMDLLDSLEPVAGAKGVAMHDDLDPTAVLAWGIPPDLVSAFENLLENAIRYSRPGGEVQVRVERREPGEILLTVADRGIGIPEELKDQIFHEFVRAPNARRHAPEGTGLGLTVVREVVEAHGGRVEVVSQEGSGSAFTAFFPVDWTPPEVQSLLQQGNQPVTASTRRRGAPAGSSPKS